MDRFWYGFIQVAVPVAINLAIIVFSGSRQSGGLGASTVAIAVLAGLVISTLAGLGVWLVSRRPGFSRAAAPTRITPQPTVADWTMFLVQCACVAGILYFLWRMAAPYLAGW